MVVYGFYVYDRHCQCTFYANCKGKARIAGPSTLPNVFQSSPGSAATHSTNLNGIPSSSNSWDRSSPARASVVQGFEKPFRLPNDASGANQETAPSGLAFDEEAKLVYGIVLSLRNMVKKLSGVENDLFHSFSTSAYKLHYLRTPTSLHFVLVTSPMSESLRFVLQQIHTGAYAEFVVRNPMVNLDSQISGKGIDNEAFRAAVSKLLSSV